MDERRNDMDNFLNNKTVFLSIKYLWLITLIFSAEQ